MLLRKLLLLFSIVSANSEKTPPLELFCLIVSLRELTAKHFVTGDKRISKCSWHFRMQRPQSIQIWALTTGRKKPWLFSSRVIAFDGQTAAQTPHPEQCGLDDMLFILA